MVLDIMKYNSVESNIYMRVAANSRFILQRVH